MHSPVVAARRAPSALSRERKDGFEGAQVQVGKAMVRDGRGIASATFRRALNDSSALISERILEEHIVGLPHVVVREPRKGIDRTTRKEFAYRCLLRSACPSQDALPVATAFLT